MCRMNQLPRQHAHAHLPLLRDIPPIVSVEPVLLLVPDFVGSDFLGGGVHFLLLEGGVSGRVGDRADEDGGVEGDSLFGSFGGRGRSGGGGRGRGAEGGGGVGANEAREGFVFFSFVVFDREDLTFSLGSFHLHLHLWLLLLLDASKAQEPAPPSSLLDGRDLLGGRAAAAAAPAAAAVPSLLVATFATAARRREGGRVGRGG
mmetsp:Transcript_4517/g.8948  ORF Transcript_4517/g.8948 Transcript_4517/m.8948 type:complete len:203 (+) Transcript_4517:164-772(+)